MKKPGMGTWQRAIPFLFLLAGVSLGGTVPLKEVVPDYMEGDLETAIIPTPHEAHLKDTAFPAGKVVVVMPDPPRCSHPNDTLVRETRALFGGENVVCADTSTFTADKRHVAAETVVFVGNSRRNRLVAGHEATSCVCEPGHRIERAGEDGYVLHTAPKRYYGKNVVVLAGSSAAGDFWAFATLRQMVFERQGTCYVREGTIVDFPRFRFRGNKRPRAWEWRYKANYGWFFQARKEKPARPGDNFRWDYFRHHGAWVRHGDPLMATDQEMDNLINGYDELDGRTGRRRHVRGAIECYRAGCREFVLKFDDTGSRMSDATEARFGRGNFHAALHHYITGMYRRLKAIDRENQVFFMPRPYFANSFELGQYAKSLLEHGPLPEDIGLSVCGPEVISRIIPTGCLKEFRELFGFKRKAQIYDNYGRGGEYFACHGRDADLWKEVSCIFPERGTPVTRITVYDYLWNPEAYDPKRSLRLAIRELSSRKPQVYAPLLDYVLHYNRNRYLQRYASREGAAAHFRKTNRILKAKYDALVPVLEKSPMAMAVKLADELWGTRSPRGSFEWGEYARLRRRLEFEPSMRKCGWQEATVARAGEAPKIDGRLDEAAWKKAPAFDQFARAAWGMKTPPENVDAMLLTGEESTRLKLLYTRTHIYVGVEFNYKKKPELPGWAKKRWEDVPPGHQAHYAWRVPCFELFFDVNGRRADYYQIISNIAGIWLSKHFGAYEAGKVGESWRPHYTFAFSLGERRGTFEAAIPFADIVNDPPRPGDVWGFQCFRSKMGTFGLFSGAHDLVGGEHAASQFGRIVFR